MQSILVRPAAVCERPLAWQGGSFLQVFRLLGVSLAVYLAAMLVSPEGACPRLLHQEDPVMDSSLAGLRDHFRTRLPEEQKMLSLPLALKAIHLSRRHLIPLSLILALIETESSYRPHVVSSAGAIGLMQLLPSTAHETAQRYSIRSYRTESDLMDPIVNLELGVAYLAYLRLRFAEPGHFLAAYNLGPSEVTKRLSLGETGLEEVRGYVEKIQRRDERMKKRFKLPENRLMRNSFRGT